MLEEGTFPEWVFQACEMTDSQFTDTEISILTALTPGALLFIERPGPIEMSL